MHTCEPPIEVIEEWLSSNGTIRATYGHLLLEQQTATDADLIAAMRPYFESAHLDAREYFHRQIAIDLHPDADAPGAHACYPGCLPSTARRGLFGEVMAGMMTEAFQEKFVGGHEWRIPIFLFREHADVEAYLWDLARDPARTRQIFGRFGSDLVGLGLARLYQYGFSPLVGRRFEEIATRVRELIAAATTYGEDAAEALIDVFEEIGELLAADRGFGFRVRQTDTDQALLRTWTNVLGWWMHEPDSLAPEADDLRAWQRFVADNAKSGPKRPPITVEGGHSNGDCGQQVIGA